MDVTKSTFKSSLRNISKKLNIESVISLLDEQNISLHEFVKIITYELFVQNVSLNEISDDDYYEDIILLKEYTTELKNGEIEFAYYDK